MVSFPKIKQRRQPSEGPPSRKRSGLFRICKSTSEDRSTSRDIGGKESLGSLKPSTPVTPLTTGTLSPDAPRRVGSNTPFQDVQVAKHRSDVSRGDNSTVISELTNPPRVLQQEQSDLELVHELQPLPRVRTQQSSQSQIPEIPVPDAYETPKAQVPTTTSIETVEEPIPETDGYFMRVLSMMEQSCMGTLQVLQNPSTGVDRKVSFAPEWGVPPTKDDDDSTYKSVSETRTYRSNTKEKGGVNGESFVRSTPSGTRSIVDIDHAVPDDGTAASHGDASNQRTPSRADVLLQKARSARERKKKADNERRYKAIIMSLKDGDSSLPTVDEGKVRVPQMDGTYQFLQTSDFIGKESIDDEATTVSKYSANELLGAQHMPEENSRLFSNSRGWLGMLGMKGNNKEDTTTFSTTRADTDIDYDQIHVPNEAVKPQWKEVVDPVSGRVYYYHRATRETTWKRPPEDQLVKKNRNLTTTEREIREIMEEKMPHTDDNDVLSKRDRIARMLTAMAPPNAITVEELVIEFAGREDDLIKQLRSVNESKPFDEPVQRPEKHDSEDVQPAVPIHGHSRSAKTVSSAYSLSTRSRLSEMTPQIRNTRTPGSFHKIYEDACGSGEDRRVPSDIPVPRRRDLKVEEYSSDRIRAETFETRRAGPVPRRILNQKNSAKADGMYLSDDEDCYLEKDADSFDNSGIHDSVSEYSANVYDTRRRDLEDAIGNEDWDLAAALSEGMRSFQAKNIPQRIERKEGEQSELDLLISKKDWDGVAGYIAQLRMQGKTAGLTVKSDSMRVPSKQFGANSRLQQTSHQAKSTAEEIPTISCSEKRFRFKKNQFAC